MDEEQIVHYPPETKPEWSGEDLPPVGTVCEYKIGSLDSRKCEYIGKREKGSIVILDYNSGHFCCYHPHQITLHPAKSNKEKWIDQAIKIASRSASECDVTFSNAIYEALASGELPIPKGIKNEPK